MQHFFRPLAVAGDQLKRGTAAETVTASAAVTAAQQSHPIKVPCIILDQAGRGVAPIFTIEVMQNLKGPLAVVGYQLENSSPTDDAAVESRAVQVSGGIEHEVAWSIPVLLIKAVQYLIGPLAVVECQLENDAPIASAAVRGCAV